MATLKESEGWRRIPTAEYRPDPEKSAAKISSLARLVLMPWPHGTAVLYERFVSLTGGLRLYKKASSGEHQHSWHILPLL